jgi:hypothetical protein
MVKGIKPNGGSPRTSSEVDENNSNEASTSAAALLTVPLETRTSGGPRPRTMTRLPSQSAESTMSAVSSIGSRPSLDAKKMSQQWFDGELHQEPRTFAGTPPTPNSGESSRGPGDALKTLSGSMRRKFKGLARKMSDRAPPVGFVPGEPAARPRVAGFGQKQQIKSVLNAIDKSNNPKARILVVGFSPTGGGHTKRCLEVVRKAVESGELAPGSTVVMQVPQKWQGNKRSPELNELAKNLLANKINLLNFGADKSVQGFLNPDGSSDDAQLVQRFAMLPRRQMPDIGSILDAELLTPPADGDAAPAIDYNKDFPTLTAKQMFQSLQKIVDQKTLANKTFVLTDMAPDLHKAASAVAVTNNNRVEQSNHPILLRMKTGQQAQNQSYENAVLTKVLNSYGGKQSYIGLGDRNTLTDAVKLAQRLNIDEDTTKDEARLAVVTHLLAHGLVPNPDAVDEAGDEVKCAGIMTQHPLAKMQPEDVQNVVFVYAHNSQNRIARYIRQQLDNPDASDAYKKTMFVFAGNAVDKERTSKDERNALHAAFLAHADGISTMGAGVAGEVAYLHNTGGQEARLGALPIKGHNEQMVNAEVMETEKLPPKDGKTFVDTLHDTADEGTLRNFVDQCVNTGFNASPTKYQGTMEAVLDAVSSPRTYVQHTHDRLFAVGENNATAKERSIATAVTGMAQADLLKATRRLNKMVIQVAQRMLEKGAPPKHPVVVLSQKAGGASVELRFKSFKDFVDKLGDDKELQQLLGSKAPITEQSVKTLKVMRSHFEAVQQAKTKAASEERMKNLLHFMGELTKTGF